MDQLKRLVGSLSVRQRWTIVLAGLLVCGGLFSLDHWQRESGYRPLYAALPAEDAAAVVQKLKEEGVSYHLSAEGGSISVPQERIPELRLEMAGAGLPKNGRIGFEIFDKTNFGMTDFAEHINYQRAIEGELERSVMALSQVEQARVHVSFPQESVFTEARKPAKASVLIRLRSGAQLPETAMLAITNLISSAVEGLAPESVSVLDMRGNLLNRPKRVGDRDQEMSESALEYRHQVEQGLVAKLDATLEPLIGAGRFRAAVSADCDLTSGEQSEESFDPTRSVMVNSQKTEDISSSGQNIGGIPGTAANLPDAAPRPASGGGVRRSTESISYQTSRIVKRTVLPQGAIRRLSVSVLLDNEIHTEGAGPSAKRILTPPSPERLKAIHDLAAAAIGLDMERGDLLTVESLPFESSLNLEPLDIAPPVAGKYPAAPVPAPWYSKLLETLQQNSKDRNMILGAAAAGLLVLLAVIGLLLRARNKRKQANARVRHVESLPPPRATDTQALVPMAAPSTQALSLSARSAEVTLTAQVREAALADAEGSAGVLRGWLREGQA